MSGTPRCPKCGRKLTPVKTEFFGNDNGRYTRAQRFVCDHCSKDHELEK